MDDINQTANQSQTNEQPMAVKPEHKIIRFKAMITLFTTTTENVDKVNEYNIKAKRGTHDYEWQHAIVKEGMSKCAEYHYQGTTVLYDDRESVYNEFVATYDDIAYALTNLIPSNLYYLDVYAIVGYSDPMLIKAVSYEHGARSGELTYVP